jgi:hypothetical protein
MNRRESDTDVLYEGDEPTAARIAAMLSSERGIDCRLSGGTVRVRRFELKTARIAADSLLDRLARE